MRECGCAGLRRDENRVIITLLSIWRKGLCVFSTDFRFVWGGFETFRDKTTSPIR